MSYRQTKVNNFQLAAETNENNKDNRGENTGDNG